MFGQNISRKNENFNIFVVSSIDDFVRETYTTGVRDFIFVPLRQAQSSASRLGNDYCVATDNEEIAKEYGIKLLKNSL